MHFKPVEIGYPKFRRQTLLYCSKIGNHTSPFYLVRANRRPALSTRRRPRQLRRSLLRRLQHLKASEPYDPTQFNISPQSERNDATYWMYQAWSAATQFPPWRPFAAPHSVLSQFTRSDYIQDVKSAVCTTREKMTKAHPGSAAVALRPQALVQVERLAGAEGHRDCVGHRGLLMSVSERFTMTG